MRYVLSFFIAILLVINININVIADETNEEDDLEKLLSEEGAEGEKAVSKTLKKIHHKLQRKILR